jgi:hypothetical protein
MTADRLIDLIGRISSEFDRLGWRDTGDTARMLAQALVSGQSPRGAASRASSRFFAGNGITREALERVLKGLSNEAVPHISPTTVRLSNEASSSPAVGRARFPARRAPLKNETSSTPSRNKWLITARASLGALIGTASGLAIFCGPNAIRWTWLLDHPNRLGIEWGAFFVALSMAGGVAFWRWQFFGATVVAGILVVIQLVGR